MLEHVIDLLSGVICIGAVVYILGWLLFAPVHRMHDEDIRQPVSNKAPSTGPMTNLSCYLASFHTGDIDAPRYWYNQLTLAEKAQVGPPNDWDGVYKTVRVPSRRALAEIYHFLFRFLSQDEIE